MKLFFELFDCVYPLQPATSATFTGMSKRCAYRVSVRAQTPGGEADSEPYLLPPPIVPTPTEVALLAAAAVDQFQTTNPNILLETYTDEVYDQYMIPSPRSPRVVQDPSMVWAGLFAMVIFLVLALGAFWVYKSRRGARGSSLDALYNSDDSSRGRSQSRLPPSSASSNEVGGKNADFSTKKVFIAAPRPRSGTPPNQVNNFTVYGEFEPLAKNFNKQHNFDGNDAVDGGRVVKEFGVRVSRPFSTTSEGTTRDGSEIMSDFPSAGSSVDSVFTAGYLKPFGNGPHQVRSSISILKNVLTLTVYVKWVEAWNMEMKKLEA